ncbi:hypothetical protein BU17DRAFT_68866 [Hysterangium stoloniferum]|nr:hypothetical protein BU17DRAFT_68866 [Hysterangium stoloniferum]
MGGVQWDALEVWVIVKHLPSSRTQRCHIVSRFILATVGTPPRYSIIHSNHGGAPLQRATHTAQHTLPSHRAVTVHLDDSPLRDTSEFIGDAWLYPQTDAETISTEYEIIHISSDSSNPSRLHESKMDRANDASHTPARALTNTQWSSQTTPVACIFPWMILTYRRHEAILRTIHRLSLGRCITEESKSLAPDNCLAGGIPSPSLSPLPSHCPWGGIYLSDGRKYPCPFNVNRKGETKVLEHWAREHVANEIFALHVGLITEWHQAHFVDCLAKLWTATLDLGICPDVNCLGKSYKAVGDRREMVQRHLLNYPECEASFTEFEAAFRAPPKTGYTDMVEELGYGNPTNLS